LTSQSLWVAGLLVVGIGTALSMSGPSIVRRYVPVEKLTSHNDIAGFKFATAGVLYAVLLAFVIIVVWEKFSAAQAISTAADRRARRSTISTRHS